MDFNQLKPLISRYGENQTIVPEWVEGQLFYVVSDELLKKLIDEVNDSRLLREKLAMEIEATCNGSGDSEMGGYGKYFANLVRGKE